MFDDHDFDSLSDPSPPGTTSAAFMKARAPVIRSKPCTPVTYKASSLKQPLNGLLKGNRLKRRNVSFAPNALTWSHEGFQSRQRIKNSEEDSFEDFIGSPQSPANGHRPCTPTVKEQFSHLPAFLQPEAPPSANGIDAHNSSDSDTDSSRPDSSDDDTFFTPTVNPTPLANGDDDGANGSGDDSDRSASLSVNSAATNVETESDADAEAEALVDKKKLLLHNGTSKDGVEDDNHDSDGSMVAGGGDSDGSVVFGSDDGANNSDEEVPEFAKKKPATLPTTRAATRARLRTGLLGASGNSSPLAEAKRGLSQGLSQLPSDRRFQPRLSSWSKKRREMRGLRPPPSYTRLQARKALEAPSPIRRSAVYSAPSPTNAQGEESNTPKEGNTLRGTQRLNSNDDQSPIVCSPAVIDESRTSGSKSSSASATDANGTGSAPVIGNGVHDGVSRAELKEVHAEIDSLKKLTHSVIEKLDTLTASFQELRNLNLVNRLDVQADSLTELKKMVSSHAQSTNDRVTDLSTVVESLSDRVASSSHRQMLATQAAASSSHIPQTETEVKMNSLSSSPRTSSRSSGTLSMHTASSSPPRAPTSASSSSQSVDLLQESICELRAFTKDTFENFERMQRSQHRQLLPTLAMSASASAPASSSSFSPLCSPSARLKRRNSASARKGRSKHAQQLARTRRADSAPGPKPTGTISRQRTPRRPVRPRIWGYGSIAFLIMLVVMFCYFSPALVPYLERLPQFL